MAKYLFYLVVLICFHITYAQTKYELTPGVKGNELTLTLSNISSNISALDLKAKILKPSSSLIFNKDIQILGQVNPHNETDIKFVFDVKRNAPVNKTDTVVIQINSSNGVNVSKEFLFTYLAPKDYKLAQNYPNPFNPSTTIQYQLPFDSRVSLIIYDILGKEVATLINEQQPAGFKEITFNAQRFASGVYIYRLSAGKFVDTKKMMVLK
ncbi:MAG: T9SS type A sorting domain-containing protein [Ignavibacteriaceae bacterium]|nr:T9SS type A sorting domain-containing protein [Ignavibacteriaceae bacterium]